MENCLKLAVFVGVFCIFPCSSDQCSKSYPFERFLGTRTPYRLVSNNSMSKIEYEDCRPVKLWMIIRHGTRNPSVKNIELMSENLPRIKEYILQSKYFPNEYIKNRDLDLFRKWKLNLGLSDEQKLTHEGEEEMLLLAERMQSRFPDILTNFYSNTSYKFKYTFSQRTKKSAFYFAAGLFGKHTAKDVWYPEPSKRDPILRFYKLCRKWKNDVKEVVKLNGEHKKFEESPEVVSVVKEVNERLRLHNDLNISDILTMYITCGFEIAWNKRSKSPWCSPFSDENLRVLEYLDDLKHYWQDGYGHELTYRQACPVFGDLINTFEANDTMPKTTVYFTHSGTLLKLLAHIGLYKDLQPLTGENFRVMSDRKWRTSLIDSFGTNLAFILFECGNNDERRVLTMHQENIVRLPACPLTDLCELKKINQHYSQSIKSCDFDNMCDNKSG